MAKLRADMTYNQRLYQESNIIIPNSELQKNQEENIVETERNILSLIQENEEVLESDDNNHDDNVETISKRFDENLAE